MMDLAYILNELEHLCQDPDSNMDAICDLLARKDDLAEFEVARFRAAKALGGYIEPMLRSVDPRERSRAVKAVRVVYPRLQAGRLLRTVVKDPDSSTRAHARFAVRELGLDDVALPDTRNPPGSWVSTITRTTIGAWNPTGWWFGAAGNSRYSSTRPDVLERNGLPVLRDLDDIADLVGVADAGALTALCRPGTGVGAPYVEFEIAKARGGTRRISAPRARLKQVQRAILREILGKLAAHDACHGFTIGRSVVSNAAPHERAALIVKTDLRDFFPTVHFRRIHGLFQHYGYGYEVAGTLASLTTHRPVMADGYTAWPGFLPQGAPTSPALANLVCRRLDARLTRLAGAFGATYTRYADDLTFSFAEPPAGSLGRFHWWIDQICQQEGFVEHTGKRRVLRRHNQQRVTGIVVNDGLRVPRADRRRFRAILHNCRQHGLAAQARGRSVGEFMDYLRGFAAYVKMVQPELGGKLVAEVEALLAGQAGAAR